jgi:glycosyltransferase involved in cell wall biosynthesis
VIASEIDGSVGLLGEDYAGYFPVQDTQKLSELLLKAETDPAYLQTLAQQCSKRAPLFTRDAEKQAWADLLSDMGL